MNRLIDVKTSAELKAKFEKELKENVEVTVFTGDIIAPGNEQQAELNAFTKQFIKELSELDGRIVYREESIYSERAKSAGLKTSPSVTIGLDKGYKIIYNGAPLGHEATGVIETIAVVSSQEAVFNPQEEELIKAIKNPVNIKVFVTPTCPYCPRSVVTANRIAAVAKGLVTAECVESSENRELAMQFQVSSVPQQVINDDMASITVGAQPEPVFILQVLKYGAPEKYAEILEQAKKAKEESEKLPDDPEGMVTITDGNFNEAVKKYGNLVIDCWAEWCMPCRQLSPIIESLAQENKGKIVYGKMNVDENPEKSGEYGIMSIPTMLLFKDGEKAGQLVGVSPKQQLDSDIKKHLKLV